MHTKLVKEEKHDSSINHLKKGMMKKTLQGINISSSSFFLFFNQLVELVYIFFFVESVTLEIEEMLLTMPFPIE